VEAALKLARQYFTELPKPQRRRTRFIAREQSYHGNTLGSLSVSGHPPRRALYEDLLPHNVSHISSCNPYRGKTAEDTDETYVARLAQELEDEFHRVGPENICAFIAETVCGSVRRLCPRL
jgi:adenosylmethionine-8-amino-7-oxononanoate aminotransferase